MKKIAVLIFSLIFSFTIFGSPSVATAVVEPSVTSFSPSSTIDNIGWSNMFLFGSNLSSASLQENHFVKVRFTNTSNGQSYDMDIPSSNGVSSSIGITVKTSPSTVISNDNNYLRPGTYSMRFIDPYNASHQGPSINGTYTVNHVNNMNITSISPSSAAAGSVLTVNGSGFTNNLYDSVLKGGVSVNGVGQVSCISLNVVSDTRITCQLSNNTAIGQGNFYLSIVSGVINSTSISNSIPFTVNNTPGFSVSSITPYAYVGETPSITIAGSFPAGSTLRVKFVALLNNINYYVTVPGSVNSSGSQIDIPLSSISSILSSTSYNNVYFWGANITVFDDRVSPAIENHPTNSFVLVKRPNITSISPSSIATGAESNVVIEGTYFQNAQSNGGTTNATINFVNRATGVNTNTYRIFEGNRIPLTIGGPNSNIVLNPGVYDVSISEYLGAGTTTSNTVPFFAVGVPATISSINPTSVVASSNPVNIGISGTGFVTGPSLNSVCFDSVCSSVTTTSGTYVVLTVQPQLLTAGTHSITVNNGVGASNSKQFTVTGSTSTAPTASLRATGAATSTTDVTTGDVDIIAGVTNFGYEWSSTNAVRASSVYSATPSRCGSGGAWYANTLSGSIGAHILPVSYVGCNYVMTYTATNSSGVTATSVLKLHIKPNSSVPAPTAQINATVGGRTIGNDVTVYTGQTNFGYQWSSTNAVRGDSTYTVTPSRCGPSGVSTGTWLANTPNGSIAPSILPASYAGCYYVITYVTRNSAGAIASDVLRIHVLAPSSTTTNTTTTSVATSSNPTASLTANGLNNLTLQIGESLTYNWSSTNAVRAASTYTATPSRCGPGGAWSANTLSGSIAPHILPSSYAGCSYVITYTATDSAGVSASSVLNLSIVNPPSNGASVSSAFSRLMRLFGR